MNVVTRPSPEETRARIIETADALFRRLGFAKTTVADIAGELGMSPANVYRFFPSKHAIVEAICTRCLGEIDENAWAVARARGAVGPRLERLFEGIIRYHKENFISEKRLHDIVLVAIEENWGAILEHKKTILKAVELILRDGIESGEIEPVDPRETAEILMRGMIGYCHPVLVAQAIADGEEPERDGARQLRFLLKGIVRQG
ncbi:MAG: TetR/AcrR family transcriptional regulator [Bauldia sp.]|nr:TetR/AcrR family transcriptional regulator [Bauldia sp.]